MGKPGSSASMVKKLTGWFSESGRISKIIVAAGIIGILLIMISELAPQDGWSGGSEDERGTSAMELEAALETRLEDMISRIEGAGSVSVMVTLESGVQQIDSGERSASFEPEVKGVAVICQGADSPVVTERITSAVTTALGIPSTRVCVLKMGKQFI